MASLLRDRLIYLSLLTVGFAALVLGWSAFADSTTPSRIERYVEGVVGQPERINPLLAGLNETDADIAALVFDGLTRIDGRGMPQPNLAERWDITADGLSYRFQLRADVFWHDGQRFDALDVAFTIALVQASAFRGDPSLAAAWAGVDVTVVDALTVEMVLPEISASFLTRAALGIVPEHQLAGLDAAAIFDAPFNRAPIGTGPFRVVELTTRRALLERHTTYHEGLPGLREFEFRFFRDRSALTAAIASGELHGALLSGGETATANDATDAAATAEQRAVAVQPSIATTALDEGGYTVLYLNTQRESLASVALRQAIAAAIDVPTLLAALPGGAADVAGAPGSGPILPGSWAYAPGEWPDPSTAPGLLDVAGWLEGPTGQRSRNGFALTLELVTNTEPLREALAAEIARRLTALGIIVDVEAVPSSELVTRRLVPRDYEMAIFGWETGADPDPYGAWHTSQILAPGSNVAGYHDPLADALLEAGRTTLDEAERRQLYAAFTERFAEMAPSIVLHCPQRLYAHPRSLRGLSDGVLFDRSDRFRSVHLWHEDGE
ncbi:MAG TPA: peptide ABC transporter substrate-binding protein [Dehalococcoidia bacterium]|nr:peptide ABC transporter substrate-binding protein [Dehalococcoidia bacterium]